MQNHKIEDLLNSDVDPEETLNKQIQLLSVIQTKYIESLTNSIGGLRKDFCIPESDQAVISKMTYDISVLSREARQWAKQKKDNLKKLSLQDKVDAIGHWLQKQTKAIQLEVLTRFLTKIND